MDEEIPFNRQAYYGYAFKFYCYDSFGNIGEFRSGYLPIPRLIFTDESAYKELSQYFLELPKMTNGILVEMFAKMKAKGNGDFAASLGTAQKGLYAIGEIDTLDDGKHINGYYLVACPEQKINVVDLSGKIRELIEPYYFPVDFSKTDEIDITKFFECV